MYPIFNRWVHCGQVLSVPTMYSPCVHWVYGSLSPVSLTFFIRLISFLMLIPLCFISLTTNDKGRDMIGYTSHYNRYLLPGMGYQAAIEIPY